MLLAWSSLTFSLYQKLSNDRIYVFAWKEKKKSKRGKDGKVNAVYNAQKKKSKKKHKKRNLNVCAVGKELYKHAHTHKKKKGQWSEKPH